MFTLIPEFLRAEPIIRLRPGVNPYNSDSDTERSWQLSVKINNAWRRMKKKETDE